MHRTSSDSPFFFNPPTDQEIEIFTKYRRGGPTVTNFCVDVRGKNLKSSWNKQCASVFANEFVKIPTSNLRAGVMRELKINNKFTTPCFRATRLYVRNNL